MAGAVAGSAERYFSAGTHTFLAMMGLIFYPGLAAGRSFR